MTPQQFVSKWKAIDLKESAASREHFHDICRLVNHPTPIEYDRTGKTFGFETPVAKEGGGRGFADVWFKDHFGWEYKSKGADLDAAYKQLLQYRESLENPWLLIVSDMDLIVIHPNFPNTVNQAITITMDNILEPGGLEPLRFAFFEPERLKSEQTTEQVTQEAAREFSRLAKHLGKWGEEPEEVAHFLIRILFCLFAEDIGLLPRDLFTQLIEQSEGNTTTFTTLVRRLFRTMSTGGFFGVDSIAYFDGGLFDDDSAIELDSDGIDIIKNVTKLDWASIEPAIIGTLFERSLDPEKRAQLGAHYTSKEDILLIVEPVLMEPFNLRWSEIQKRATDLELKRAFSSDAVREEIDNELDLLFTDFGKEISHLRVLDPACGSGNFLYVALQQLLDLEKELIIFANAYGISSLEQQVSPHQLYGIEVNEYAHELAQATVWIGYLQWLYENGFDFPDQPVLKPLDNFQLSDALLSTGDDGLRIEADWPSAEVIISNPPFLGSRKMRPTLGDDYCDDLHRVFRDRIRGTPDLVCFWFEKARSLIEQRIVKRAGLLATQSIRGGTSRQVLDKIKDSGDIFMAWSDREWILDGATVHVSMVGFDDGSAGTRTLNGQSVSKINSDLTSDINVTTAKILSENSGISYQGIVLRGPFNIPYNLAMKMLQSSGNPNGRPNSDVIKERRTGQDIMGRPKHEFIIDFWPNMSLKQASQYELPFEYVKREVYPKRQKAAQELAREKWWLHWRSRNEMRKNCQRLIDTLPPLALESIEYSYGLIARFFPIRPWSLSPVQKIIILELSNPGFMNSGHDASVRS